MTPMQQKKVDIKGLQTFMCRAFCLMGILTFIIYIIIRFITDEKTALLAATIPVPFLGVFYILIGAQRYDHNK